MKAKYIFIILLVLALLFAAYKYFSKKLKSGDSDSLNTIFDKMKDPENNGPAPDGSSSSANNTIVTNNPGSSAPSVPGYTYTREDDENWIYTKNPGFKLGPPILVIAKV